MLRRSVFAIDGAAGFIAGSRTRADLDEPYGAPKAMGADGYKAYLAKLQPFLESVKWTMWRFLPDLSYVPDTKP